MPLLAPLQRANLTLVEIRDSVARIEADRSRPLPQIQTPRQYLLELIKQKVVPGHDLNWNCCPGY